MDLGRKIQTDDDSDDADDSGRIPTQSDQPRGSMTRKRRRGIIEKRRRDRINNCLSELKRLVPAAFEKQGSQKLEKAEILQMTVEHLRFVHSKGADSLLYDSQRYASDYHSMGFRECTGEVARYLSMVEGMELQDPVRLRLLSHLQSCNAQRIASTINPWTTQYTGTANSWPATSSVVPKFETPTVQYSTPYASLPNVDLSNNGYSNGSLNSTHYSATPVVSIANQAPSLGSLRAPMPGSFQPVGNGSGAGLNLNLTFLAPASSGGNGSSMSNLDKIGYGRNGWNTSDMSY